MNNINPMKLLQLKGMLNSFTSRHPKFPNFLKAVYQNALQEGSVLEIRVTTPDGANLTSNLKITKEDLELFHELKEMRS